MSDTYKLYDGEVTVEFNEGTHRYKVNGSYKTGVTTILNLINKPHLIQWSANMAVQAMIDGVPPDQAKYAHTKKRDKSADTGSKVHEWIENHLQGKDLPIDKDMRPSVEAFKRWAESNDIEVLDSERILYSKEYDYCGTVDLVFNRDGKRYVADFKTSDTDKEWKKWYTGRVRARLEHLLQCAMYDQALTEELGTPADSYMVIYITKEGKLHYFDVDYTKELKEGALSLVRAFQQYKQLDSRNEWRTT
jgi:hypothetical protein